ncbi:dTDP-4-dehydrorhamnose reductase [Micromonospora parathelypteridis]|uniref:dTDP-4-dehydrorhamnose reductase n=1 Tax=Micromonospora parathelypteridis TaxID=1839617 RepID=A0A840W9S7_9ACTN|nr:dTDP-4-dehydrorhamnose reductase [Micromonospora parathelypteridis]MBB5481480.1 dTDP-4-dehydrorhamnose reductase [Micromonospora parathelypteridis]GGO18304.1 NAD(P)-dependent oxidoreductase [Micromonospora parathelypteridis]
MTRLLVTGAGGMLARDLVTVLHTRPDLKVTAASRADLDITDPAAVREAVAAHDIVINTAAWTNVDGAEANEAAATAVNGDGVANLASACAASGARLIQVSTDYVLAGDAQSPYPEDAPTAPVNAYGRGKLVGEQAVAQLLPDNGYVVRTAWLYGAHGPNFVATMLRLAGQREFINVVDDQHGQPTWSYRLAERLVALAEAALEGRAEPGIYHSTCAGQTTWYGLARATFTLAGLDPDRIRPTTSDQFPLPAPRPAYSVLGHSRWAAAGLPSLPDWHTTLVDAFASPAPPAPWKVA